MDDLAGRELSPEEHILESALAVIAEYKISGTRMREIAERAGISQGTLHYYFPTKANLLLSLLDDMQRTFDEDRRRELAAGGHDAAHKLRLFPRQQQRILAEHPYLEGAFFDFWGQGIIDPEIRPKIQWMYSEWRTDIEAIIAEGVEAQLFDETQTKLAPFLLVSLMEGAALQHLIEPGLFDLDAYFEAAYRMVLDRLLLAPERERYPTDVSDAQWARIAPLLPPAKPGGRPRTVNLREVVSAMLYVARCGCSWRMLPHDLPNWQTVYGYAKRWAADGVLDRISAVLGITLLLPDAEAGS